MLHEYIGIQNFTALECKQMTVLYFCLNLLIFGITNKSKIIEQSYNYSKAKVL